MPQLNDILEKRKGTPFAKKKYRTWEFSGIDTSLEKPNNIVEATQEASKKREDYLGNKKVTKRYHADNIYGAKRYQKEDKKITIRERVENTEITNREQIDNFLDNKIEQLTCLEYINKLTGIQEKIFFYVVEICCTKGTLETGCIITLDLKEAVKCSYESVKMSLKRLIDKQLIIRKTGKRSKGGHINLSITKDVKLAALEAKKEKKLNSIINNQIFQKIGDTDNDSDNINLVYNNDNNTIINTLPFEWKNIDIAPLENIGFCVKQIKQLYQSGKTSPEAVQISIYHFAFALEYKKEEIERKYKGLVNAIMGVLIKGNVWFEDKYESPQEKALKKILEVKKVQQEKIQNMIDELCELEFPEWKSKLTDEKISEIVPSDLLKLNIKPGIESTLKNYFIENVLKQKANEYC